MDERRFVVSGGSWHRPEAHLPGKAGDCGATAQDNRLFRKRCPGGVAPARPAPASGHGNTRFRRFRRRAGRGVFAGLFKAMSGGPGLEYALIDGAIVSVHRKAAGARGGLGLRPPGARAAGRPPRSSRRWVRLATGRASCSRPARRRI